MAVLTPIVRPIQSIRGIRVDPWYCRDFWPVVPARRLRRRYGMCDGKIAGIHNETKLEIVMFGLNASPRGMTLHPGHPHRTPGEPGVPGARSWTAARRRTNRSGRLRNRWWSRGMIPGAAISRGTQIHARSRRCWAHLERDQCHRLAGRWRRRRSDVPPPPHPAPRWTRAPHRWRRRCGGGAPCTAAADPCRPPPGHGPAQKP